jgi:hypothetical protein
MIELKGEAHFLDGSRVPFTAYQAELGEWERYAIRHNLPPQGAGVTFSMFVAFAAIHRDTWDQITLGFEPWCRTLKGVELDVTDEEEGATVAPFPTEPSAE